MAGQITDAEARARVAQWCPTFQPTVLFPGALKPWQGTCLGCGAEVAPQYLNLQQGRGACRACGRQKTTSKQRHGDDTARERVAQWAPSFLPASPYPGATHPWPGVCVDCGDSVQPTYHSMQQGGGHCPKCGRLKSQASRRLTDDVARMRASEYSPNFQPNTPYPGNNQTPWFGRCTGCGRDVSPTYANIQQGGSACAYCAGAQVDPAQAHARYIQAGGIPDGPYPGKNSLPWPGTCGNCGKRIKPTWASISKPGRGCCNYCAKTAAGASRHLDPNEAAAFITSLGFEPLETYPGTAGGSWRMRHKCGLEQSKSYNNLQQGHSCSECAEYAFRLDLPAVFYIVANDHWIKGGITNKLKRRLVEHRMAGLRELLFTVETLDGRSALELERRWLEARASLGREMWATSDDLANGYTETVRRTVATEELLMNIASSGTN